MLQRLFAKYKGVLRNFKWVYVLNNLLQANKLRHNRKLYRQFGLRKSIYSPIGSSEVQHLAAANDLPWLDRPGALAYLREHPEFHSFSPETRSQIEGFIDNGYLILRNFFPAEHTEALNREVDALLAAGKADYNYTGRKIFNLFESSALANEHFFRNPELLRLLSFILGKPVIPFQSLNFTQGSEQKAHSDSIHMTTAPPGYMIAAWIALEDCPADCGPLFYYPGSHRLPYIMTPDYPSGNTALTIGEHSNRNYEKKVQEVIDSNQFSKAVFLAHRGDVLLWHANLLHGGSAIQRSGATRRSMVCHYFAEGVICYHEISQRPAILPKANTAIQSP
jgi:ectoine hydroxylase